MTVTTTTRQTDVFILGGGAAGLMAAATARRLGARVSLAEERALGGDCLHHGCVPSKALIHVSREVHALRRLGRELTRDSLGTLALHHARRAVKAVAPHDSLVRYRQLGVDVHLEPAAWHDPNTLEVAGLRFRARRIILATGSRPRRLEWIQDRALPWVDTDGLWALHEVPHRLTIVGAGASGVELAQSFVRLGHDVHLLEVQPRILPGEDQRVSRHADDMLKREGVAIHSNTRLENAVTTPQGIEVLTRREDGEILTWITDLLILTLGRMPPEDPPGMVSLALKRTSAGYIEVDRYLRTNVAHIYACGDITGPPHSTARAGRQGWCAASNALLMPFVRFDGDPSPHVRVIYTDPEFAILEDRHKEPDAQEVSLDLAEVDRALIDDCTEGFLHFGLDRRGRIRRAVLAAPHASELVGEISLAITRGFTIGQFLKVPRPYPVYGEALTRAAARFYERRWEGLPSRLARGLVTIAQSLPPYFPGIRKS